MIQKIVLKASQEELYSIFRNYSDVGFFLSPRSFYLQRKYGDNVVNIKFMFYKISAKEVKYSEIQMFLFV